MLLTILWDTGQSHTHNDMASNINPAEAEKPWPGAPRGALSLEEIIFIFDLIMPCLVEQDVLCVHM